MTDYYELYENLLKMTRGWHPGSLALEYFQEVLEESDSDSVQEAIAGAIAVLTNKEKAKKLLLSLGWDEEIADDMLEDVSFKKSADMISREIDYLISRDICPVCGGAIVTDGYMDYGNGHSDMGCGWTTTKVYCEDCGEKFND